MALGFAMAAYFWFPAVDMLSLIEASNVGRMFGNPERVRTQAISWQQLFLEQYGSGGAKGVATSSFACNQGRLVMLCVLLSVIAWVRPGLSKLSRHRLGAALVLMVGLWFVMSPAMPWERVPGMFRYLQFPWRLLVLTSCLGCAAIAMAAARVNCWMHPCVLVLAAAVSCVGVVPHLANLKASMSDSQLLRWNRQREIGRSHYAGCLVDEYKPAYVDSKYMSAKFHLQNPSPANRLSIVQGHVDISAYARKCNSYCYHVRATAESVAKLHVFDFPGWRVFVDGVAQNSALGRTKDGLVRINIPAGEHDIKVQYHAPQRSMVSYRVSMGAWGVWCLLLLVAAWCREAPKTGSSALPMKPSW